MVWDRLAWATMLRPRFVDLLNFIATALLLLVLAISGDSLVWAEQDDWSAIRYPFDEHAHIHQASDLTFAARAPPTTSANVATTGTELARTAGVRASDGMEPSVAALAFDGGFLATNNILTTNVPTSGRKFNQLTSRGWDQSSIDNVVNGPVHTSTATNRATGNPATAYFDSSGNYVVRDNVTGDLVQMSNRNDPNWIPDPSITDPYIP